MKHLSQKKIKAFSLFILILCGTLLGCDPVTSSRFSIVSFSSQIETLINVDRPSERPQATLSQQAEDYYGVRVSRVKFIVPDISIQFFGSIPEPGRQDSSEIQSQVKRTGWNEIIEDSVNDQLVISIQLDTLGTNNKTICRGCDWNKFDFINLFESLASQVLN